MNDRALTAALRTIHRERTLVPDATAVREQLLRVPLHGTPQRRSWWPSTGTGSLRAGLDVARFTLAGVIVALFAGLLLTGSVTQLGDDEPLPGAVASASAAPTPMPEPTGEPTDPPEAPVSNTDLVPGVTLLTQEVEPGVLRIVNDGVRDLSLHRDDCCADLKTGRDGSVWLLAGEGGPIRLGDARAYETELFGTDSAIGPDGTIWSINEDRVLMAFDGDATTRYEAPDEGEFMQVEATRDGTIWATWRWRGKTRRVVGRLDGSTWRIEAERRRDPDERGVSNVLAVTDGGDLWLGLERVKGEPLDLASEMAERFGFASDGTLWIMTGQGLVRLDATGLTRYKDDRRPQMGKVGERPGLFAAAPDGSLWVTGQPTACLGGGTLYHFDGAWTSYGGDGCVFDIAAAPNGALWSLRREGDKTIGVYVIPVASTRD